MNTIKPFASANFSEISKHIKDGGVCILPTDTIFGLSADPSNLDAIKKVQKIKKRSDNKPFLLLVPSVEIASKIVEFSDFSLAFAKKIWPSECTIILPRKKDALPKFFPDKRTLAIRIPNNKKLLNFLKNYWKNPLISTSVNLSNQKEMNDISEIKNCFSDKENLYICTDKANKKVVPSTIIEIKNDQISILREGVLSRNIIDNVASEILK